MKDTVELEVDPDGTIRTMYQDGIEKFAEEMGGTITTSCRASDVEWEEWKDEKGGGWTVRSAYDHELALRFQVRGFDVRIVCSRNPNDEVHIFETREEALKEEQKFFWELLAPKKDKIDVDEHR